MSAKFGSLIDNEGAAAGVSISKIDTARLAARLAERHGREAAGNSRRGQLKSASYIAFALSRPRSLARERMQPRSEHERRGRQAPALKAQANLAPHEILGLGIGEEDTAILRHKKDRETHRRDRDYRSE